MDITYFGHNCFLFESDVKVLSDPCIRENELASHIDVQNIQTDYVLITHGHWDHVADAKEIAENHNAEMIGSVEVIDWFRKKGYLHTSKLNFGGSRSLSDNTTIKYVQAQHSSSLPDGSYGGQPGSFIIQTDKKTIFLAGDTSLHYDLKMYGELFSFDLLILPIGGTFTMDINDAMNAADFLNCDQVIGCHYDTFPSIKIDKKEAIKLFKQRAGKDLHLLEIGQIMSI